MATDPKAIVDEFVEAWNRADADALAGLFVEDADFVNVVGLWWTSRSQIRYNHAYGFRHMFPGTTVTTEKVTVRHLGADYAVVHAIGTLTGQVTPTGELAGNRTAVLSFTVGRQRDGQWLAVSAQNTDRVPGAQTHLAAGNTLTPVSYGL
jgi:uncharacterized protein (TIGR02246 family)